MNEFFSIAAKASEVEGAIIEGAPENALHTEAAPALEAPHSPGLSLDPWVVGFQVLNFVILIFVLHKILYKPLTKLLAERAQKIKDGVENAEKAEVSLREANTVRSDMMKNTKVETQTMMEKARKEGEATKNVMAEEAQEQAKKIVENGHQLVEMEKAKAMEELKKKAVGMVMMTAEKVLREKMDATKDAKMIEESLNSFAA